MILFSFPAFENIARQLQTVPCLQAGRFTVARYANQELHAHIEESVSGEHCLILGTIAPPDECLLSVSLLSETLEKEGAHKITAVLPYLAYSRQDKEKPGESLGTAWVGALLKSSGIDDVVTVDVHSERDKQLFPIPLTCLSTNSLFADTLRNHGLLDATIVAPDNGAIGRCEAVKRAAGMPVGETPYFEKKRTDQGIIHHGPVGRVGEKSGDHRRHDRHGWNSGLCLRKAEGGGRRRNLHPGYSRSLHGIILAAVMVPRCQTHILYRYSSSSLRDGLR